MFQGANGSNTANPGNNTPVRHRAAEEQRPDHVRAQGRQLAVRRPDRRGGTARCRTAAATCPMHQEGVDHPGHRRRQQQPQHGHLLRGRDDRPATRPTPPTTRCRPTSCRSATPAQTNVPERPAGHDHRPGRQVRRRRRRRHRRQRHRGAALGLPDATPRTSTGRTSPTTRCDARPLPGHQRQRHGQRHPGRAVGLQRRRRPEVGAAGRRLAAQPAVRPLPRLARAAPPPTARGCRSGTATARPRRSSRSTAAPPFDKQITEKARSTSSEPRLFSRRRPISRRRSARAPRSARRARPR